MFSTFFTECHTCSVKEFGVSFSIKQCRNFNISPEDCLTWLIKDCGFRRFRLMSYWDEIESTRGSYDFKELDNQIKSITKSNGAISLCLGARQPRWPENHWPDWAWQLSTSERTRALLDFIKVVVERYKGYKCIINYQLENEALMRTFGTRVEVDRKRLRKEFVLVKLVDRSRPIVMSTSTSWGIPFRRPIPDIVGFSYYQTVYNNDKQAYITAFHKPWVDRLRAMMVKILWRCPSFIHELQLEPWGPKNIWEMSKSEQMKSMSIQQIKQNIRLAYKTGLNPIDLWGGEWWYWCHLRGDNTIIDSVLRSMRKTN